MLPFCMNACKQILQIVNMNKQHDSRCNNKYYELNVVATTIKIIKTSVFENKKYALSANADNRCIHQNLFPKNN